MTYEELQQQFSKELSVENGTVHERAHVVVGAMGGSALPAHAVRFLDPTYPISSHRDYDLPERVDNDTLYVAISYSGNTAETFSFAEAALSRELPLVIIASGGKLIKLAEEHKVPFVRVPSGLQPRDALFLQLRALLLTLGQEALLPAAATTLTDHEAVEVEATKLAGALTDTLPLFYSTRANGFLANVAKIVCNETAKMPAYANMFPELNHNEMEAFDTTAPEYAQHVRFVLLRGPDDDPRIVERMNVFAELMHARNRRVVEMALLGEDKAHQLVRGWYLIHHLAVALAQSRGVDPANIELIEEFKKRI